MGAPASPQLIGRYCIHGKIASGGMASVHFGRLLGAVGFSRTVAIKRLHPHLAEDPEFVSTMLDEARLAARIHHPNVVPTLDVVAVDGELLLVMEYVRGESLARLLAAMRARESRVPLPIASAIIIGALHGLHAAHEATSDRGTPLCIVHRDVSPQNILVGIDGVARIIDFGVAKASGRLQTTRDGVVKGKIPYMAPEQLSGDKVTPAVDVYATGVVFWEMLAGRRLFQADADGAVVTQVLAGAKDPPSRHAPDLHATLDALVMRALAPDPADRFASAEQMAEILRRVVPPAFSTDVGRWVEGVAREALEQRGAALAEIEGSSGVTSMPVSDLQHLPPSDSAETGPAQRVQVAEDSVPTIASEASSLSVETPKPSGPGTRASSRRTRLAGTLGAGLLLIVTVAAFAWRNGASSRTATGGDRAKPTASALAPASAPDPVSSASAAASLVAPMTSAPAVTTAAAATSARPPSRVTRPRAMPKPAGSIRFAQPD